MYCCISRIKSSNQLNKIEEYEWDIVVALQNMLHVFYDATIFLSSCYYPTITQVGMQVHLIQSFL